MIKQDHPKTDTKHDDEETPTMKQRVPAIPRITPRRMAVTPGKHLPLDSIVPIDTLHHVAEDTGRTDSSTIIQDDQPQPGLRPNEDIHIAERFPEKPAELKDKWQKWSIDLAYNGSIGELNANSPFVFTETETTGIASEIPCVRSFERWSDYAEALQSGTLDINYNTYQTILKIAQNNAALPGSDKIERSTHHYMPITFSLALKYKLNNRFGLETGLSYSRLKSESDIGTNGNAIREQQTIHYIGIPLKGTYHIYHVRRWNFYESLGAKLEIPVYTPFSTTYYVNGTQELSNKSTRHVPWQWSVGTGLGLQYDFTPNISFFAEPSLLYYIPTGSDIETYRTEHPFTFSLPLGIRITW